MVSFSVSVLVVVVFFFFIAFAYVIWFRPKGRRVILEFYEEMGDKTWYRIEPHKVFKGLVFRQDGIEKLKVPVKFSKLPLEAVNIANMTPSTNGVPVIKMVKDAEGMFRPVAVNFTDKKTFRAKVEQREPLSWLFQENERIQKRYAKGGFWEKYGAVAVLGIIIIGGMLAIYTTGQQINELNDDYRQDVLGDTREQKSFMIDLVNNLKDGNNNNVETSENADTPPSQG